MSNHRLGQDPAELQRQRSAAASKAAGQSAEHPADVAEYIARRKAMTPSIPTPGAPAAEPAQPEPSPAVSEPPAGKRPRR